MKVVFLDCDGVLNSIASALVYQSYQRFDPIAVGLLERLCRLSDAKIVISSSWRIGHQRLDTLVAVLRQAGVTEELCKRIIGMTGRDSDGFRGEEVKRWLHEHDVDPRDPVTHYVILDDDADFHEAQKPNFVQTCNVRGFGFDAYKRAIHILCAQGGEHGEIFQFEERAFAGWRVPKQEREKW